jgi:hypothetical protein
VKRVELDDRLYDQMIEETSDDPMTLVPPELLHLIPGFLERREKEVGELAALLEQKQFADVKAIGHRLKGTGEGYGFPLVSDIGRELEAGAESRDSAKIRASIAKLADFATGLKALLFIKADN